MDTGCSCWYCRCRTPTSKWNIWLQTSSDCLISYLLKEKLLFVEWTTRRWYQWQVRLIGYKEALKKRDIVRIGLWIKNTARPGGYALAGATISSGFSRSCNRWWIGGGNVLNGLADHEWPSVPEDFRNHRQMTLRCTIRNPKLDDCANLFMT